MYGLPYLPKIARADLTKFVNDCISRNGCRIYTTEPNQMILVSFFSEDNILSDEIKICYICEYQRNENRAFRFYWNTRYSAHVCHSVTLLALNHYYLSFNKSYNKICKRKKEEKNLNFGTGKLLCYNKIVLY